MSKTRGKTIIGAQGERQGVQRLLEEAVVAMSHELRTPLAAIKGYATTLMRHDRRLVRDERIAMLGEIGLACDRMTGIIEHALRAVSLAGGAPPIERTPVDLIEVVDKAIEEVSPSLLAEPSPRAFRVNRAAGSLTWVAGDRHHLIHVITNLLENAALFSAPETPIEIELANSVAEGQTQVVLRVRDHGAGIPPHEAERVFEPFFRIDAGTTQSVGGLGLGLTYCRRIVELHGGAIHVEQPSDGGATLVVHLPLASPHPLDV